MEKDTFDSFYQEGEKSPLDTSKYEGIITYLLSTIEGREFLSWLLDISSIMRTHIDFDNFAKTSFLIGQQSLGRQILAELEKVDPKALYKLGINDG